MKVILNKEEFYVGEQDFQRYYHPEYSTLELRPKLGILEREISLIADIAESFGINTFINHGLSFITCHNLCHKVMFLK